MQKVFQIHFTSFPYLLPNSVNSKHYFHINLQFKKDCSAYHHQITDSCCLINSTISFGSSLKATCLNFWTMINMTILTFLSFLFGSQNLIMNFWAYDNCFQFLQFLLFSHLMYPLWSSWPFGVIFLLSINLLKSWLKNRSNGPMILLNTCLGH